MPTRTIDCTAALAAITPRVRTGTAVSLEVTAHTYLPHGELVDGWFPVILRALQALRGRLDSEGAKPRSLGTIGVGAGLDAITAVEVLDVKSLVLTDLHDDLVAAARSNVLANCPYLDAQEVSAFRGDLCTGLVERGTKVDVLMENLPNLPAPGETLLNDVRTASFFSDVHTVGTPSYVAMNRLVLHWQFLLQARHCLSPKGTVVCLIGGRVPPAIVRAMFKQAGYRASVLEFAVVRQFEAAEVLTGYVDAEREGGGPFRFYPFEEAREVCRELRKAAIEPDDIFDDPRLRRMVLTPSEAVALHDAGGAVGHIGIAWRGNPVLHE